MVDWILFTVVWVSTWLEPFQSIGSWVFYWFHQCCFDRIQCRHCKRFAPTYESVAIALHSIPERNIKVAKVDGSKEVALASRFSVRGFPSFYLIDGWDVYEFKDSRSREKLINFATKAPEENEVWCYFWMVTVLFVFIHPRLIPMYCKTIFSPCRSCRLLLVHSDELED